jgi:putative redox protein
MSEEAGAESQEPGAEAPHVVVRGKADTFLQQVTAGRHRFVADEPQSVGGTDAAPDPYDYLLAGLGACTSMTVALYARRKQWPLDEVIVKLWHSRIHAKDCEECETKAGMLDRIELEIELAGELTPEQRSTLLQAAHRCPVHRTLTSEISIRVRSAGPAATS